MSQKQFTRLGVCEIKSVGLIFKTKMLILQSKANLDGKILFGRATLVIDPEIRKMLEWVRMGTKVPNSILAHDLFAIEI